MRDSGMKPRLLLVEDDPVSQAFLATAARALPAEVDCAGSLHEARALLARHRYAAWLVDANLPDGHGETLLALLPDLAGDAPRTLAHTASEQADELQRLRAAGFDAAIAKPLPMADWLAAIRGLLATAPPPLWDEEAALAALNGDAGAVATLRDLFRSELPVQSRAILAALQAGDEAAARGELHRLKAGCGFVGAARLRAAVDALHAAPQDAVVRSAFADAVALTLHDAAPGAADTD